MDQKFLRRIRRRDRVARSVIVIGGMTIIFSVIFILLLIAKVTLPLFQQPQAETYVKFLLPQEIRAAGVLEVGVDEYLEKVFVLDGKGTFTFFETQGGNPTERFESEPPSPGATLLRAERQGPLAYQLLWSDGSLTMEQVVFASRFDEEGRRSFLTSVRREDSFAAPEEVPRRSLARTGAEGKLRVDLFADGRLQVTQVAVSEDLFGNRSEDAFTAELEGASAPVASMALDSAGRMLYAGTGEGGVLRWDLSEPGEPQLLDRLQAFADGRAVTALAVVLGDISLAVGDAQGGVTTWFPVRSEDGGKKLRLIHRLSDHGAPVAQILPSRRDKSVLALDEAGTIHLDHMTSERHLLTLDNLSPLRRMGFAQRGNGVVAVNEEGRMVLWSVDNPHPEVSFKTLFGKVWYESYDEPVYAWQSSSASDDFEPKFSLTPLIFGTFKATLYAMLFAVPLALLGAVYTSQFASARLRRWIKPTVEIMAAIPSVVIGFLAALWFAPLLEEHVVTLLLILIFAPSALAIAVLLWRGLRRYEPLKKMERGYEFVAVAPVLVLTVALAAVLGPMVESLFFGGDFQMWLFSEGAIRYDQRNSIVIAFALGLAVIPIIFTIAEDSLSNVPPSLRAASLAMGASRWQTVWRVILPSASPGIFAGVMIGFGRAIGETMIVLMATGNTAILDWSIFNGMRPLSANIAVEIPEAPVAGTLYRILFLSAVLLFTLTFVLNTVAEVVRQNLRKKYGRF